MKPRGNPWLLALLVIALCAGVFVGTRWWRARNDQSLQDLLARIHPESDLVLYVDIAAMRQAHVDEVLRGSPVTEEAEYLRFVTESGFDWRTDLDSVLVSRRGPSFFALARGRFDWKKINAYVTARGAGCKNAVCDMAASTPGRRISIFPLSSSLLAIASSPHPFAVYDLLRPSTRWRQVPAGPVWLTFPVSTLRTTEEFPSGSRLFAKALEGAERISLSLDVTLQGPALEMRADCRDAASAESLAHQLRGLTGEFRKYFDRLGQQPNPADLSGLLLAGQFQVHNATVVGQWPVTRLFLENLAGGRL